jgi:hypothetical protein
MNQRSFLPLVFSYTHALYLRRITCLECGKALENARAMLAHIKPKLPARKLPAAPVSFPNTPETCTATTGIKFVCDNTSFPPGTSPTSAVWGDDVAEDSEAATPASTRGRVL